MPKEGSAATKTFEVRKNHSNNSKCYPTLKKEKQNDFKKRIKRNKFDTFFFLLLSNFTALV